MREMRDSGFKKRIFLFTMISFLIIPNGLPSLEGKITNPSNANYYDTNEWFNGSFNCRWKINFDWPRSLLVDFQVLILIPPDFNYELLNEDGSDIRFTTKCQSISFMVTSCPINNTLGVYGVGVGGGPLDVRSRAARPISTSAARPSLNPCSSRSLSGVRQSLAARV